LHKVTDLISGNTHYPPLLLDINCETTELISVDVPETVYRENSAYDMEGSAFYGVASRFVSSELVQIVKIVSDNLDNPSGEITKNKTQVWVTDNLTTIAAIVDQLQSITFDYNLIYALSSQYLRLVEKVHLTASQQVQLKNLVSRFHALGGTELERKLTPESHKSSRNLIKKLKLLIEEI